MSRRTPLDKTGLCAYPGCDLWAVRSGYCEPHAIYRIQVPLVHQPSMKPRFDKPEQVSGKHRHNRPDGTPILRMHDGTFDPGSTTITREEYHRRFGGSQV